MSTTVNIAVLAFTAVPDYVGQGSLDTFDRGVAQGSLDTIGAATFDACLATANDGHYVLYPGGTGSMDFAWDSGASIPVDAVIVSVEVQARFQVAGAGTILLFECNAFWSSTFGAAPFVGAAGSNPSALTTFTTGVLTTNPVTGLAWTRAELAPVSAATTQDGFFEIALATNAADDGHLDWLQLTVIYDAGEWWFNPTSNHYVFATESPGEPFVAISAPTPTITGVSPRFI